MFARVGRGGHDGLAVVISFRGVISHLAWYRSRCLGRFFWSAAQARMSRQYIDGEERRRSSRVSACETVHLRLGATYCTGRVINLSAEGALVELDRLASAAWRRAVAGLSIQPGRRGLLGSGRPMPAFRADDRHALARTTADRRDAAHRSDDRPGARPAAARRGAARGPSRSRPGSRRVGPASRRSRRLRARHSSPASQARGAQAPLMRAPS